MASTTYYEGSFTVPWDDRQPSQCPEHLFQRYESIVTEQRLSRTEHLRLMSLLGSGGQGVVYLSERRGIDNFTFPVAVKIFSPVRFRTETAYVDSMGRMAQVAAKVAQIQQDNLIDVYNWIDRDGIRLMEMEWVDGYDMKCLLTREMFGKVEHRVSERRWKYINEVIVTSGPVQPRLKPGIAVAIVRECLSALAALHRANIVHGDIKPSNIMVKRTGNAKLIDLGSAFHMEDVPARKTCTPLYAAPEVLDRDELTPQSDLASLGYVLIEMLSGVPPFMGRGSWQELLQAKQLLAQQLDHILPHEVTCNKLLMNFCHRLVAPDPARRFTSADAANILTEEGAAAFHRQLVKGNLASEYDNEIRLWLEELADME